jgi:hypothetical protein
VLPTPRLAMPAAHGPTAGLDRANASNQPTRRTSADPHKWKPTGAHTPTSPFHQNVTVTPVEKRAGNAASPDSTGLLTGCRESG